MIFSSNGFLENSPVTLRTLSGLLLLMVLSCQKDPSPLKNLAKDSMSRLRIKTHLKRGVVQSPWGIQKVWYRDFSGDRILVEGDMLLPASDLLGTGHGVSLGAFAVMTQDRLWPEGMIWYDFEAGLDSRISQAFDEGVRFYNEKTKFKWTRKEPDSTAYHVLVKRWHKGGGLSSVGRSPENGKNYQEVLLDLDCLSRCLRHEMGHVMGLWHEHSRPDRDDYLVVHFENISAADQGNFSTINLTQSQILSEFDLNSIMLYGSDYLSKDKTLRSMSRKDGGLLIASDSVSDQDISALNRIWQQWFDLQDLKKVYQSVYGTDTISQSDYKLYQDQISQGTPLSEIKFSLLDTAEIREEIRLLWEKVLGKVPEGQNLLFDYLLSGGQRGQMERYLLSGSYVRNAISEIHSDLYNETIDEESEAFTTIKNRILAGESVLQIRSELANSPEMKLRLRELFSAQLGREPAEEENTLMVSYLKEGGNIRDLKADLPAVMVRAVFSWFFNQEPSQETENALVTLLRAGASLIKIRGDILAGSDFGSFVRKTIREILNRDATGGEFTMFTGFAKEHPHREARREFVENHPQLEEILISEAEEIWGVKPSSVQISAWKQELIAGTPVSAVISSMLESAEAVASVMGHLKNLLGKDLSDPQIGIWKDLFWEDWKDYLGGENGLSRWREKIIDSESMKKELEGLFKKYLERAGQPSDYLFWQEMLKKDPDLSLPDLSGKIAESPEVAVKLNIIFNRKKEKDLDFSDLEELSGRLQELGDWKELRKEIK